MIYICCIANLLLTETFENMENSLNPNYEVKIESTSTQDMPMWNHHLWKTSFSLASKRRNSFDLHALRIAVFTSTVNIVKKGSYQLEDGTVVPLALSPNAVDRSILYSEEIVQHHHDVAVHNTEICAVNEDCLVFARRFIREHNQDVCVLNMANRRTPGGGVINGAGAQEEYLFRSSSYYLSLFQFSELSYMYGIKHAVKQYPLDRNFGGVYSPDVTVFRGPEEEGYQLLDEPWKVNMIAVPAMNRPRTVSLGGELHIVPDLIKGVKNKMRTILRIAAMNRQDTLVLGAFGCGAFHNPPRHTAELFKEVIEETEFNGIFKHIFFVIKEDHNSESRNFMPFADVFGV